MKKAPAKIGQEPCNITKKPSSKNKMKAMLSLYHLFHIPTYATPLTEGPDTA